MNNVDVKTNNLNSIEKEKEKKILLVESTGHDIIINEVHINKVPSLRDWIIDWLNDLEDSSESNNTSKVKELRACMRYPNEDDYRYIKDMALPEKYKHYDVNIVLVYELELDYYDEYKYLGTFNPALYIIEIE